VVWGDRALEGNESAVKNINRERKVLGDPVPNFLPYYTKRAGTGFRLLVAHLFIEGQLHVIDDFKFEFSLLQITYFKREFL
jgi:hypothetical protein